MILHAFSEPWQDDQPHVAGAEENGERLSCRRDDMPSYCIICQLFQPFVLLADSLDGLGVAAAAVCLKCMFLGAQDVYLQISGQPHLYQSPAAMKVAAVVRNTVQCVVRLSYDNRCQVDLVGHHSKGDLRNFNSDSHPAMTED